MVSNALLCVHKTLSYNNNYRKSFDYICLHLLFFIISVSSLSTMVSRLEIIAKQRGWVLDLVQYFFLDLLI